MSTILIQKNQKPKKMILGVKSKLTNSYFCPNIKAEDFAGLSWILLNNGDEI